MNKGFIIIAQDSETTNYIKCAELLCQNIKMQMPNESVTLLTDKKINLPYFDNIIIFPYGDKCINDSWKLANDWQVYDASPYEFTIKIEADFYLPRSISHWWEILKYHDLNICTTIRNYKNEISDNRFYRKIVDSNNLPDTYNGLTYFKKSKNAENFYQCVKDIFENWNLYKAEIKCPNDELATTDFVYAIAASIIGEEICTMPHFNDFSFIHMKKAINSLTSNNWFEEYVYEISRDTLRINTIPILYPLHYHVKEFCNILRDELNE